LHARTVGLDAREQELGEHGSVGVRVITADDDDGVEVVLDAGPSQFYLIEKLVKQYVKDNL
jgi:hypothetical protein